MHDDLREIKIKKISMIIDGVCAFRLSWFCFTSITGSIFYTNEVGHSVAPQPIVELPWTHN